MKTRYYIDPGTGDPHIYKHGVTEQEVEEVLERPMEDRVGHEGARVAIGRTRGGRYLRVVYVQDPDAESVFIVTAYELGPKPRRALLQRRKKRP